MPGADSLTVLLVVQVSLIGMLQRLPRTLVSSQVIFFAMVLGAATMGMGGQVTVLNCYLL